MGKVFKQSRSYHWGWCFFGVSVFGEVSNPASHPVWFQALLPVLPCSWGSLKSVHGPPGTDRYLQRKCQFQYLLISLDLWFLIVSKLWTFLLLSCQLSHVTENRFLKCVTTILGVPCQESFSLTAKSVILLKMKVCSFSWLVWFLHLDVNLKSLQCNRHVNSLTIKGGGH